MKETYKILIISEVQGYIIMSLKDKIKEAGYQVSVVEPDVAQISAERDTIGAYLIYGSDGIGDMQQALIYLKDQSAERDIPIFTVGSREENDAIGRVISGHLIRQFFERPVNVNELVEVIDTYIAKFGAQHKKKVLVVDDSGAMLRNVKGWLEDRYQVILANSGAMAIKYLATNRPDLVLLDYEMPVVDGRQVLEMIRTETEFSDVPVIFLTSKDDRESVMQVMALKPEGYLLKTMEPARIIAEVDAFFERQRAKLFD